MHPHDIRVAELTKERDDARAELHDVRVAAQATIADLERQLIDARRQLAEQIALTAPSSGL